MKAFCLSGILLLGVVGGCSAEAETRITAEQDLSEGISNSGVIIDKQDGRVLLVPSAEKQDILNGAIDNILAEHNENAIWVRVPSNDYSTVSEGDIIRYFGEGVIAVDASFPAQTEAARIEIQKPADWTDEERARLE